MEIDNFEEYKQFEIINTIGKIVYLEEINSSLINLELKNNLKEGVYILKIIDNKGKYFTQRIIIQ